MCCTIWSHRYNLKNVKLVLAEACNFTEINTSPWPFFCVFKIIYPLRTSENIWSSGVLKGYRNGTVAAFSKAF